MEKIICKHCGKSNYHEPKYNEQQREFKSYEDRIQEYRDLFDIESNKLQGIKQEILDLEEKKSKLDKELNSLNDKIGLHRDVLDDLNMKIDSCLALQKNLDNKYSKKEIDYKQKIGMLEILTKEVEKKIESKKKELSKFNLSKKDLDGLDEEIKVKLVRIDELEKEIDKLIIINQEEKQSLEWKKIEVNQLIEKNSLMVKNLELDRNKLEIYIRRLQRYYDESGIRLKILSSFGLE